MMCGTTTGAVTWRHTMEVGGQTLAKLCSSVEWLAFLNEVWQRYSEMNNSDQTAAEAVLGTHPCHADYTWRRQSYKEAWSGWGCLCNLYLDTAPFCQYHRWLPGAWQAVGHCCSMTDDKGGENMRDAYIENFDGWHETAEHGPDVCMDVYGSMRRAGTPGWWNSQASWLFLVIMKQPPNYGYPNGKMGRHNHWRTYTVSQCSMMTKCPLTICFLRASPIPEDPKKKRAGAGAAQQECLAAGLVCNEGNKFWIGKQMAESPPYQMASLVLWCSSEQIMILWLLWRRIKGAVRKIAVDDILNKMKLSIANIVENYRSDKRFPCCGSPCLSFDAVGILPGTPHRWLNRSQVGPKLPV